MRKGVYRYVRRALVKLDKVLSLCWIAPRPLSQQVINEFVEADLRYALVVFFVVHHGFEDGD